MAGPGHPPHPAVHRAAPGGTGQPRPAPARPAHPREAEGGETGPDHRAAWQGRHHPQRVPLRGRPRRRRRLYPARTPRRCQSRRGRAVPVRRLDRLPPPPGCTTPPPTGPPTPPTSPAPPITNHDEYAPLVTSQAEAFARLEHRSLPVPPRPATTRTSCSVGSGTPPSATSTGTPTRPNTSPPVRSGPSDPSR